MSEDRMDHAELEMDDVEKRRVAGIIGDLASSPGTRRLLFVAQSKRGEWFTSSMVKDESGSSEAEMIAEYIQAIKNRTGREHEDILREIVENLNNPIDGQ